MEEEINAVRFEYVGCPFCDEQDYIDSECPKCKGKYWILVWETTDEFENEMRLDNR